MTAAEVLSELKSRHVELVVDGDRLRFRPVGAVPEDLRAKLRAHKAELVELLKLHQGLPLRDALPGGVVGPQTCLVAESLEMSLEEFAGAGLVVEVWSGDLDEAVVLASDDAVVDPGELRVVYRAAELRGLVGVQPRDLRNLHDIKKTFRGSILPS
jgi:TubC N-terminal docking domain